MKLPHLLTAALLTASASALPAATVFDNGAPNQFSGNEISDYVIAEDFSLSGPTTVTGVRFWLFSSAANFPADFNGKVGWAIYDHNGVGNQPGTLLFSGTDTTPTVVPTGALVFGSVPEHQVDIDISAVLAASTTYWLALHEGDWGSSYDGLRVAWESTGSISGNTSRYDSNEASPGGNWQVSPVHLAFQLSGEPFVDPVPEPGTWAAAGFVALAGVWSWRRRQRRQ